MNISFNAKIPISQCQVLDRTTNKFVNATFYEFDCKDISDIKHFKRNMKRWIYKDVFVYDMHTKFKKNTKTSYKNSDDSEYRFYSLEMPNNYIIGFCETEENKSNKNICYLETEREQRYKYSGQGILASLAKQMLGIHNSPTMTISNPANSARKFYLDKCGFKEQGIVELFMDKKHLSDFIRHFEHRTQMPIFDCSI